MLLWITESANWYALFVHFSNTKLAVSVYGSIKTRGNVLPVETCSAQICGFHIDHIAGSFSLIFALVINIPFVWCLVYALGVGVRFQNPLEAISSFITISHFLPLPLVTRWILSSLTSRVLWNNCPQPSANSGSLRDTKLPFIVCWQKDLEHIKGKQDDVNQIWDFVIVAKILTYSCRATKPPNLTRKRAG